MEWRVGVKDLAIFSVHPGLLQCKECSKVHYHYDDQTPDVKFLMVKIFKVWSDTRRFRPLLLLPSKHKDGNSIKWINDRAELMTGIGHFPNQLSSRNYSWCLCEHFYVCVNVNECPLRSEVAIREVQKSWHQFTHSGRQSLGFEVRVGTVNGRQSETRLGGERDSTVKKLTSDYYHSLSVLTRPRRRLPPLRTFREPWVLYRSWTSGRNRNCLYCHDDDD